MWDLAGAGRRGGRHPPGGPGRLGGGRAPGGQTGKTVRPKLYIAAGISGAIQHRVGMEAPTSSSPSTPTQRAHLRLRHHGIVGNAMQVLPALTDRPSANHCQAQPQGRLSAHRRPHEREVRRHRRRCRPLGQRRRLHRWPRPACRCCRSSAANTPAEERAGRHPVRQRAGADHPRLPRRRAAGAPHHRAAHVGAGRQSFVGTTTAATTTTSRPTTATPSSAPSSTSGSVQGAEAGALVICETTVEAADGWPAGGGRALRPPGRRGVCRRGDPGRRVNSTLARKAGFHGEIQAGNVALAVKEILFMPEETIQQPASTSRTKKAWSSR
jgi:hypothetical protein